MTGERSRPNLKSLALHLGLSVTTVSRALHNGQEVRKETVERVQKAAIELGYVRDLGGVKLRTGLSYSISVMMWTTDDGEFANTGLLSLLAGIYEIASRSGYSVQAIPVNNGDDILAKLRDLIDGRHTDGILFDHTIPDDGRATFLLERDFPFVTFGRTTFSDRHPWFDVDSESAAYDGTRALLARGYRRIYHVNPLRAFSFAHHRLQGYRRALSEAGIDFVPELVAEIELNPLSARQAIQEMLDRNIRPDAFLCANDVALMGVLTALKDNGLDPRGFGLACSSGTPLPEFFPVTPITLYYPLRKAGSKLADLLIRRIAGEPAGHLQELAIADLIVP